ncbi:hypothetical protein DICPUDRAFT_150274 [Dictyostelium purpureum]|uniref:N-acetyltransferase domain-containing protein n=1 Tax=Dictyostelium purpureum TaxID=5786 RepID=F0ZFX0_DICPU|nr:uncharacterized protein DICPUDRAFT_150274 [Dictyostelium purpureum]EGC37167.1 hypothetical protein DICPUDRAFT_150274 [Dictyostelium purpureum]|eukprot:XP_003286295.1 hypothetical protein DICPUDRAFT_150274 [Dictyostelium purpureum]
MEQINEPSYILRDPKPGDMGMVVYQNAVLYSNEYGWNSNFEALVAKVVSDYLTNFDARYEKCWIAEKDGKVVGSIFVVKHDENTAKLRLLYVDSSARGLGIASKLVDECIKFAQKVGYKKMILWTNSILVDAARIYKKFGFQLESEEKHSTFGPELVGQTLSRNL